MRYYFKVHHLAAEQREGSVGWARCGTYFIPKEIRHAGVETFSNRLRRDLTYKKLLVSP